MSGKACYNCGEPPAAHLWPSGDCPPGNERRYTADPPAEQRNLIEQLRSLPPRLHLTAPEAYQLPVFVWSEQRHRQVYKAWVLLTGQAYDPAATLPPLMFGVRVVRPLEYEE